MFAMGPAFFRQATGGVATLALSGSFAAATVGVAYSSSLAIIGGLAPYSLTSGTGVASGSLPAGLALSISGANLILSGTPTTAATSNFTVAVDSGDGQTATSAQSVTTAAAAASYASIVMGLSPLGYWRCGETTGSVAADSSGHGYDGTYVGGTQGAASLVSNNGGDLAYGGTGAAGRIDVGAVPALYGLNRSFSIVAWVLPTMTADAQISGIWSSGLGGFCLRLDRQSSLAQVSIVQDYQALVHTFLANLSIGVRYCIGLTVSATGVATLYVNGAAFGTYTLSNSFIGTYVRLFADGRDSTTVDSFLYGTGDELSVFNYELSAANHSAIYSAGA